MEGWEIIEISNQIIDSKNIIEVQRLYIELTDKLERGNFAPSKEVMKKSNEVFIITTGKCRDFYEEWGRKEINPTDEQLDWTENLVNKLLVDIDKLSIQEFPIFYDKTRQLADKKGLKLCKENIWKEKINRGNFYTKNNNTKY